VLENAGNCLCTTPLSFDNISNFLRCCVPITASYEAQYLRLVLSLSSAVIGFQAKLQQEQGEQSRIQKKHSCKAHFK
jgi:hypothetical protein